MAGGGDAEQFDRPLGGHIQLADQSVAFPKQEVADVQRDRDTVIDVHRALAVAHIVSVFDVVVDEGGLVETLDRDRELAQIVRQFDQVDFVQWGKQLCLLRRELEV